MTLSPDQRYQQVKQTLKRYGQEHLLSFYEDLSTDRQDALLQQLESQDWPQIMELIDSHVLHTPEMTLAQDIQPAPYYPLLPTADLQDKYRKARALGETLITEGKVAAFTVAGGQGTRLGWNGPKGTFPATPIKGKSLFEVFAEFILKTQEKYRATIPWYIMTSPINDGSSREFFEQHKFFGLDPANVTLFPQGTMPSLGLDGKLLLADKDKLAVNPDGHGGSLRALYLSGALEDMARRGVEQISYFQVDNPNVKCVDPLFIGLHALDSAQMSSKMLPKAHAQERVGNFCLLDGRVGVIEYSDMPAQLAEARAADGSLKFNAGSIAIHVIAVDFVRSLNESAGGRFALPFHRARKKVPYLDITSATHIDPEKPNAIKLEAFVFDALPLAKTSIILETDRVEEFAPIKNAEGNDSPATSKQLQSQRAARWLMQQGVDLPFNTAGEVEAIIELSHLTALEPADLSGLDLPQKIEPGSKLVL